MIGNIDSLLNFSNDLFQKKEIKPVLGQVAGVPGRALSRSAADLLSLS